MSGGQGGGLGRQKGGLGVTGDIGWVSKRV